MKLAFVLFSMLWCQIMAFTVDNAKLTYTLNQKSKTIKIKSIEDKSLPKVINQLTSNDNVKFSFKLDKYQTVPEQIELLVGLPERDLEIAIRPTVQTKSQTSNIVFKLPLVNLPESILYFADKDGGAPIIGSLIIGTTDDSNLKQSVFEMNLQFDTFNFQSFKEPLRYGPQPEIHHIFPPPPKTVSRFVAECFALIIIVTGVGLLLSWMSVGVAKFDNVPRGTTLIYFIGFMVAIIGFEILFFQYYMGTSIFGTINGSIVLGILGLTTGTKYLRTIGKNI